MADYVTRTFEFDGKRYYVRGKDDKDAEIKRELKKKELEEGKRIITGSTTVSAWSKEWLETYKESNVNPRHYSDLKSIVDNFISPSIGPIKVKQIKPLHLQKILNGLKGKYSDSYIDKIYDVIRQIFSSAWDNHLIMDNPSESLVKPVGKPKSERRAITDSERKLTLKVAEYNRGGLFVLIMLYCGLRPGEVAALKWCDVDLKNRIIKVLQANKSDDTIGSPKTESGIREVPVPDVLIQRFMREDRQPFSLMCTNTTGGKLTKSSMYALWKNFKRDMNIEAGCEVFRNKVMPPFRIAEDLTLYCYRHTYCTDLEAAGVPINVAKRLMGHSSIEVTARIYTHKNEESFNAAAELINKHVALDVAQ